MNDEDDDLQPVEVPMMEIVTQMSHDDRKRVLDNGKYFWDNNKSGMFKSYEECCWQAFALYVVDVYGQDDLALNH